MSRVNYLTVAQNFALEAACAVLNDAGCGAYLVGSVMDRPDYRDVDLRCILDDADFEQRFGGQRVRLRLLNAAISEWVAARTGLPIDFQFQSRTEAQQYKGPRNAMGILIECERDRDRRDAIAKGQADCPHDGEYTDLGDAFTCDDCGAVLPKEAAE